MSGVLRAYVRDVLRTWWSVIGGAGLILGLLSSVTGLDVPRFVWVTAVVGGVSVAQFAVYHRLRSELNRLRASERAARPEPLPNLRSGLFSAHSNVPALDPSEAGLVLRGLVLRRGRAKRTSILESAFERQFLAALDVSEINRWLNERRPQESDAPPWRPVAPTRGSIVTVERGPVEDDDNCFVSARSFATLTAWPMPSGWLLTAVDVVFTPRERWDSLAEPSRRTPLTLDAVYALAEVILSTIVDNLSALTTAVFEPPIETVGPALDVWSNYAPISTFIDWGEFDRASGASTSDPGLLVFETDDRTAELKRWLALTLRNNGYSGYESTLENLRAN